MCCNSFGITIKTRGGLSIWEMLTFSYLAKLLMENKILTSDYLFDVDFRIWARSNYSSISYSDGEEVEARIAGIINKASNISVLSTELASCCNDWPTTYHLSRKRANLLRPFENYLCGKSVLEIGAGCGAITRYLGEIGAKVLALEGSLRRASIVASRCRDLANVTVMAEALHHLQPVRQFDVVTLIGVLEYARKFFPSQSVDPVDAMLSRVKDFLKPDGRLIIAIENQLGLKYFAGFPEDHVGKPMFGIEEHYTDDGVVTFGRRDLGKRVSKAGLSIQQWWYPFPDYKLPSLMVSEVGALPQDDVDLTSVVRRACTEDPQYPFSISFNQERVWRPIVHNGLLGEMANSFVLIASDAEFFGEQELPLAIHYATDRRPEFAKKVVFKRERGGAAVTHQIPLYASAKPDKESSLEQQLVDQPFMKGELWQDRLLQIMTTPGWTVEQLQEWIKVWFDEFRVFTGISSLDNVAEQSVPGKYIDAVPRNMLVAKNGTTTFIDQEWIFSKELDVEYVAFRALLTSLSSIRVAARPLEDGSLKVLYLLKSVMSCINIEVNEHRIEEYFKLEAELDQLATGKQTLTNKELISWFTSLELHSFDTQTPVHEKLARCDKQLATVSQDLAQRDEQLAVVSQTLAQHDKDFKEMLESMSWRITRPLRIFRKWLKSF